MIQNIDCFEGFKGLADDSYNHVLTSPPYNRKRNDKYSNYDDTLTDYFSFLTKTIDEALRISKDYVFFNIQKNYYNKSDVYKLIGHYGEKIIDIIIWNKSNPMPANGVNVTNAYEFILVLSKTHATIKSNSTYTKNHFTTNVFSNNKNTKVHKAVMHPEACRYVIDNFTKEGDSILDPFAGLGTTELIAIESNRTCDGFELSEEYCQIANDRIQKAAT